jgi:hypothetical protein
MTDTACLWLILIGIKRLIRLYLDGPHMTKDVMTEAVWFANRSAPHTRIRY